MYKNSKQLLEETNASVQNRNQDLQLFLNPKE